MLVALVRHETTVSEWALRNTHCMFFLLGSQYYFSTKNSITTEMSFIGALVMGKMAGGAICVRASLVKAEKERPAEALRASARTHVPAPMGMHPTRSSVWERAIMSLGRVRARGRVCR